MKKLIKPQALQAGDTVAVVSPSWGGPGVFSHRYEAGKKALANLFHVKVMEMKNTLKPADWISKNPKARADDLMAAFSDPKIKAIIASIGGEDSIRLLPYLDLDIIKHNPKIFMGYSDTTTLHFACAAAGLSSFYGPSIMAGFAENCGMHEYTRAAVHKTLCTPTPIGEILPSPEWTVERLDWGNPNNQTQKRKMTPTIGPCVLQGQGVATGPLIGGCVEVLEMVKGSSIWPPFEEWRGAILFLETSEETSPVEYFTRWIRHYGTLGILQVLNGIILGRPGGNIPVDQLRRYDTALQQVVRDELGLDRLPLITQMDFGHTDPMFVIPYGAQGQIDCNKNKFSILETGVC